MYLMLDRSSLAMVQADQHRMGSVRRDEPAVASTGERRAAVQGEEGG